MKSGQKLTRCERRIVQGQKSIPVTVEKIMRAPTDDEVYVLTDRYNGEVAMVARQGDGIDPMPLEGSGIRQGGPK